MKVPQTATNSAIQNKQHGQQATAISANCRSIVIIQPPPIYLSCVADLTCGVNGSRIFPWQWNPLLSVTPRDRWRWQNPPLRLDKECFPREDVHPARVWMDLLYIDRAPGTIHEAFVVATSCFAHSFMVSIGVHNCFYVCKCAGMWALYSSIKPRTFASGVTMNNYQVSAIQTWWQP